MPTIDSTRPTPTAKKPFAMLLSIRLPTTASPARHTRNSSGGPNLSAIFASTGVKNSITSVPNIPPIPLDSAEYDSASIARPCRASGLPLSAVQAASPVPGQFSRIAEIEPP